MKRNICCLAVVLAILLSSNLAWADGEFYVIAVGPGVGTKITSVPCEIKNSGFYYLTGNLRYSGSGNAITVSVDDVTLDLMGFTLDSSGALNSQGIVINGCKNVEIRNGTVRGFNADCIHDELGGESYRIINLRLENNGLRGIYLSGGHYHLIQNCNITNNGNSGIGLNASGSMVTHNVVCKNGLRGIAVGGAGNSLVGNVVTDNGTHGFYLTLTAGNPYLIDRNTAYNNPSGTLNGIPADAKFGVNAGPGFP
jgi:parallel beta-helix repeat protein